MHADLNIPTYILLAWFAVSVLVTVSTIGKPRKPLDPGIAAASLVITGVLAFLAVIA